MRYRNKMIFGIIVGLLILVSVIYLMDTKTAVNIDVSYKKENSTVEEEINKKEIKLFFSGKEIPVEIFYYKKNNRSIINNISVSQKPTVPFHDLNLSVNTITSSLHNGAQIDIILNAKTLLSNRLTSLEFILNNNDELVLKGSNETLKTETVKGSFSVYL